MNLNFTSIIQKLKFSAFSQLMRFAQGIIGLVPIVNPTQQKKPNFHILVDTNNRVLSCMNMTTIGSNSSLLTYLSWIGSCRVQEPNEALKSVCSNHQLLLHLFAHILSAKSHQYIHCTLKIIRAFRQVPQFRLSSFYIGANRHTYKYDFIHIKKRTGNTFCHFLISFSKTEVLK